MQSSLDLSSFGISDRAEADIILNIEENFNILKGLYPNSYVSVGLYLHDYLYNLPILEKENIDENLRLNQYKFIDFNNKYNDRVLINTYDSFHYHHARFPGDYNLTHVPKGITPKFIKTKNIVSPLTLY